MEHTRGYRRQTVETLIAYSLATVATAKKLQLPHA